MSTSGIILEAVVGSRAYGLDTANSDTDKLGIYVARTSDFWLFKKPQSTYVGKDNEGDFTYHEAEKYVSLALKCNPTLLELLFMDEYQIMTDFGRSLIELRDAFLSKGYVRNAYLGYMTQQFERIQRRARQAESNPKKDAKNARHLWRLARQGADLWRYQQLTVKLTPLQVDLCRDFGERVAEGEVALLQDRILWTDEIFSSLTLLPDEPNTASVETWLVNLRARMLVSERERGLSFV